MSLFLGWLKGVIIEIIFFVNFKLEILKFIILKENVN